MAYLYIRSSFIRLVFLALLLGVITTSLSNSTPNLPENQQNIFPETPISITPSSLPPPKLILPQNNTILFTSSNIAFQWQAVSDVCYYRFEIAIDRNFAQLFYVTYATNQYVYLTISTPGIYYWRVTAYDFNGHNGQWSDVRIFTFDLTPTQIPILLNPKMNDYVNTHPIKFQWATSGSLSHLQISKSQTFSTVIDIYSTENSYTDSIDMSGLLYWRVRAKDLDYGYWTDWSSIGICFVDNIAPETTAYLTGTIGYNDWYVGDVTITFRSSDIGYGIKDCKYSFDYSSWYTYEGPFTINTEGMTIIYYYGIDIAGNREDVNNITFYLDKGNPQSYISIEGTIGDDNWYKSPVQIKILTQDNIFSNISLVYKLNDNDWSEYTNPISINNEGIYTIQYFGTDFAGNIEPIRSNLVKIDYTAPQSDLILNETIESSGWYLNNISIELSSYDEISSVAKIYYSFDGIGWQKYVEPIYFSQQGINTIYYYAIDTAGNYEFPQKNILKIDLDAPHTNLTANGIVGSSEWYQSIVDLNLNAEDLISEVAQIYYSFDSITWGEYSQPIRVEDDGFYTIQYYAKDIAGNFEFPHIYSFKIDRTVPITNSSLKGILGNNEWFISNVSIELNASDNLSGISIIYYSFDSFEWFEYSSIYSEPIIIENEGINPIYYYSIDDAGNMEIPQMLLIKIDLFNPEIIITLNGVQGMNDWYIGYVEFALNASDSASEIAYMYYSFDETNWILYHDVVPWNQEGNFLLSYFAIDNAGRRSVIKLCEFRIDLTPPKSNITIDESWIDESNLVHVSTRSNITLDAIEFFSGLWMIQYRINSSSWFKFITAFSLNNEFRFGRCLIEFRSLDNAGNEEPINQLLVALDPEYVTYSGIIRLIKDRHVYIGIGSISVDKKQIVIGVCNQYANWTIISSIQLGSNVFYYAEGDLGSLLLIITIFPRCSFAIAIGTAVTGFGFLFENSNIIIEFSLNCHHPYFSSCHYDDFLTFNSNHHCFHGSSCIQKKD